MENDIRWIRRFSNFIIALEQLRKAIAQKEYTELEEQGVIQCFEYTYELAWNTMKDLWEDQGVNNILGPRDAIQLSFQRGLIQNGEAWMYMMRSRNLTSHTYGIRSLHSLMNSPCVWNRSEWQENYERASLCALDCKMSISHQ